MITVSTDLLCDDPGAPPGDLIADAGAALAGTMASFDPYLLAKRRDQLLSNLTQTALTQGHSDGNGRRVRYTLEFDQRPTACPTNRRSPPGRRTRRISTRAALASGIEHMVQVVTTVSTLPVSSGIAPAYAVRNAMARSCTPARCDAVPMSGLNHHCGQCMIAPAGS